MRWTRTLFTSWILLLIQLLIQLLCLEAVPISIDKTKVKKQEQKPEELPASVVRIHMMDDISACSLLKNHHNFLLHIISCYCYS